MGFWGSSEGLDQEKHGLVLIKRRNKWAAAGKESGRNVAEKGNS